MEINLDNPIFVYYFDSKNMPINIVDQFCDGISKKMNQYTNITFWVVPADFTKIDCVFDGYKTKSESLKRIYTCLESIVDDPSLSEFKQRMRDILIEEITNEDKNTNIISQKNI